MSRAPDRPPRPWLRPAKLAALLSAALLCWLLARDACAQLDALRGPATLHLDGGLAAGVTKSMQGTEELLDADAVDFALWAQRDGQAVSAPATDRFATLSVLLVAGDTRLVLPRSATLHEDDREGCLIDRRSARELFGSENVSDALIQWDGREYTVRGVLDAPRATMLVRAQPLGDDAWLDRVSVADAAVADTFAMRHGLNVIHTTNRRAFWELGRLLSGLPLLALWGMLCAALGRAWRAQRDYPVRAVPLCAATLALATAGFVGLLRVLPAGLTPSRWSDFAAWGVALRAFWDGLLGFLSARWGKPDHLLLALCARCALGLLAALCLLLARRCLPALRREQPMNTRGEMLEDEEV